MRSSSWRGGHESHRLLFFAAAAQDIRSGAALMAADQGLIDWVTEAMEAAGTVTKRAMMGGATLYCDGVIFAIVAHDDVLWFKADATSDAIWDDAGCGRFTYEMGDRVGSMNYRRAPDDVYDDPDALRRWGLLGLEAGRRAPAKKPKKRR